jgi:LPXTG-site transpeptidase (sortase) family protein
VHSACSLLLATALVAGCGGQAPVVPGPAPAGTPPAVPSGAPAAVDRRAEPVRVRFAGLDVDAPVVPVGVGDRGEMEVPVDVHTVGWYRFGPAPGSDAGSSVLSGHVDDRVQGRGAFYRLAELEPGDPVEVGLAGAGTLAFQVSSVERVDKAQLPVERIFGRSGPPRLTLVTCGGEFGRAERSYRENVVVTAVPVGPAR